jgi:NTE family protein
MNLDGYGLVLAGGGAKGAYQVGALRYLRDLGFCPWKIAGTSIGALNGGVLASERTFAVGVDRLEEMWRRLGREQILQLHPRATKRALIYGAYAFVPTLRSTIAALLPSWLREEVSLFDPEPVERLLREAIDPAAIRRGPELWVTVFRSLDVPLLDLAVLGDMARAATGADAEWFRAQDFGDEEITEVLLASAAIPIAFPRREILGNKYVDGGLADNAPVGALVRAGCSRVIVIHLSNGVAWSRHGLPDETVIEIRPELPIQQSGTPVLGLLDALLDFSADRIEKLRQQGYEDARRCLQQLSHVLDAKSGEKQAQNQLVASTQAVLEDINLS